MLLSAASSFFHQPLPTSDIFGRCSSHAGLRRFLDALLFPWDYLWCWLFACRCFAVCLFGWEEDARDCFLAALRLGEARCSALCYCWCVHLTAAAAATLPPSTLLGLRFMCVLSSLYSCTIDLHRQYSPKSSVHDMLHSDKGQRRT